MFDFQKVSESFPKLFRKIVFRKTFRNFEKYFLVGIFFVTRYGYVVCKNRNLRSLQAGQLRTALHTLKISRILTDKLTLVALSRTNRVT